MAGLYQPQKGSIFIYKKDIHTYEKNDLHKIIHYIPQHYYLLNSSLRDNLCHGITGFIADNHLMEILDSVKMLPLLEQWPQGLDTPLGEMGTHLSGAKNKK